MTDDGALLHRIISPKAKVSKRYRVTLARPLQGDETAILASGEMMLEGEDKPLLPVEMETDDPTHCTVTLHEGRYHQVRRMFAALGNHVDALHRDRVGGLALPADLPAGEFRILGPGEIATVFEG
jgi:16S rRNA pseudouridine516 synthase